jgi:hypothetical protein
MRFDTKELWDKASRDKKDWLFRMDYYEDSTSYKRRFWWITWCSSS